MAISRLDLHVELKLRGCTFNSSYIVIYKAELLISSFAMYSWSMHSANVHSQIGLKGHVGL